MGDGGRRDHETCLGTICFPRSLFYYQALALEVLRPAFSKQGADLIFNNLLDPILRDNWHILIPKYPKLQCGKNLKKDSARTYSMFRSHLKQSWRTLASRHQGP